MNRLEEMMNDYSELKFNFKKDMHNLNNSYF